MLSAIIIDDESGCIETLQLMLEKKFAASINVVGSTISPFEGIRMISELSPDIVFLDVEMPEITGIELLKTIAQINFQIIFTSAHQQYALDAIKLAALDYLTKPISLQELSTAIAKCVGRYQNDKGRQQWDVLQQFKSNTVKKIALASGNDIQLVPVTDIVRVESLSNYSIVYLINKTKHTASKTLKEFEEQLSPYNFMRIHHSHLVNMDHVIGYKNMESGYLIVQGNDIVEISRRKKQDVLRKLNSL